MVNVQEGLHAARCRHESRGFEPATCCHGMGVASFTRRPRSIQRVRAWGRSYEKLRCVSSSGFVEIDLEQRLQSSRSFPPRICGILLGRVHSCEYSLSHHFRLIAQARPTYSELSFCCTSSTTLWPTCYTRLEASGKALQGGA